MIKYKKLNGTEVRILQEMLKKWLSINIFEPISNDLQLSKALDWPAASITLTKDGVSSCAGFVDLLMTHLPGTPGDDFTCQFHVLLKVPDVIPTRQLLGKQTLPTVTEITEQLERIAQATQSVYQCFTYQAFPILDSEDTGCYKYFYQLGHATELGKIGVWPIPGFSSNISPPLEYYVSVPLQFKCQPVPDIQRF